MSSILLFKVVIYSSVPRLMWVLVFLLSLWCAMALCLSMVNRFSQRLTVTQVKDTHYPLYLFPFPGITICPTDKIKRGDAFNYIYR